MHCQTVREFGIMQRRSQIEHNSRKCGRSVRVSDLELLGEGPSVVERNHERDAIKLSLFEIESI